MYKKTLLFLMAALLLWAALPATAAEVESGSIYCFCGSDFSQEPLEGVCVTAVSAQNAGSLMLGTRIIQPGDILTAGQLEMLTFHPVGTQQDTSASISYLPVFADRVEGPTELTISIRGKEDKAPKAKDSQLETYKNIPNEGKLKAKDPENMPLRYTIIRQPRRGSVVISGDGSFTYTPKKNKVGVDSFTYTATDPAGNVSKEATVTIKILKPAEGAQYQDTVGLDCRFEAEWLRSTGIFTAEQTGGKACFQPEKVVSRGEFTALLLEALQVPQVQETSLVDFAQKAPDWLKPYLAAAMRSGLLTGIAETADFASPITGLETAVMLQNALDLAVAETMASEEADPAALALAVMNENGFALEADAPITRAELANILYKLSITNAPGKAAFHQ